MGLVRLTLVSVCACIALVSAGCGELQLTMEDVACIPGEKSIFVGQLERDSPFGIPDALEGESISFWVGSELIGVAKTAIASGVLGALAVCGVFDLPKVSTDAVDIGDILYFDAGTGLVTLDDDTGANAKIGVAVTAAANPSGSVNVRLSGF